MNRIHFLYLIGTLLLCSAGASAQGVSRVPTFDSMIERGEITALQDTLSRLPGEKSLLRTGNYYRALAALAVARGSKVDSLLHGLTRTEANRPEYALLRVRAAAERFDFAYVRKEYERLAKLRVRDTLLLSEIARTRQLTDRIERMAQNIRAMEVIGGEEMDTEEVDKRLGERTLHLGEVTATAFTTMSGSQRWTVVPTPEGGSTFAVSFRLGDGSWESGKPISIRGLSPKGRVSYPFLLSDGVTLYFSYIGPETIGRRDLYVSRFDRASGELLVPQQLPIPFNSVADDVAYVLDEERGRIFFVTDRGVGPFRYRLYEVSESSVRSAGSLSAEEMNRLAYPEILTGLSEGASAVVSSGEDGDASRRELPLIVIGNRCLYGEGDLVNSASRALFRRYVELYKSIENDKPKLERLRREYDPKEGRSQERLASEILALEKNLADREALLGLLANEVALSEGMK